MPVLFTKDGKLINIENSSGPNQFPGGTPLTSLLQPDQLPSVF